MFFFVEAGERAWRPVRMTKTLPTDPPCVLLADPPWQHRDALGSRGAASNYTTMSTDELCAMKLPALAPRSVLLLWRVASMVPDALRVIDAWGFDPVSEIVWTKRRPCKTCCATCRVDVWRLGGEHVLVPGTDHVCPECHGAGGVQELDEDGTETTTALGMGSYVRNVHEVCVIARPFFGRAPERLDAGVRSSFSAPMPIDVDALLPESGGRRGALVHSAKPDAFYSLVERLYPGPRVEMFSRRRRPGWLTDASNQPDKLDEVARVMREVWPARVREARIAALRRRAARTRS